jgi:hypothetical protein
MGHSTISRQPTFADMLEMTESMCESGVILRPILQLLLREAVKNPALAKAMRRRVRDSIERWDALVNRERRTWYIMSARAWKALQTRKRLTEIADQLTSARQTAIESAIGQSRAA